MKISYTSLRRACLLVLIGGLVFCVPPRVRAQVTGLSYSLTPTGQVLNFDDEAGLKNGSLYGGKLGLSFGEYVELSGLFLYANNLKTDFSGLSALEETVPDLDLARIEHTVEMQRYGGEFKVNLGRGGLFPYLTAGAGLLKTTPENLNQSEAIYLTAGLGLQYSLADRYTVLLQVENMRYRQNTAALFSEADLSDLGITTDAFETKTLSNLGVTAGLQVYLGGRARGELTDVDRAFQDQFSGGLRGLSLQVEPFGGQINFDKSLGFRDQQRMAGVSAGFDFGPYVGIRGFYWRGIEDGELTSFDDLQAYGGEVKLRISSFGRNLSPFVTVGGGMMDVKDGYIGNGSIVPEDRPFAIGGGGVSLPLGNTIQLHGSVRALLMSTLDTEAISSSNDVRTNWMYSAGVTFGLGKGSRTSGSIIGDELAESQREAERQSDQIAVEVAERERALARAEARIDSLAQVVLAAQQGTPVTVPPGTNATGPWVQFPVPTQGELYVRYGQPGSVSVESLTGEAEVRYVDQGLNGTLPAVSTGLTGADVQAIVQRVLQEELARDRQATGDSSTLHEAVLMNGLERRLNTRINELERRLEDRIERAEHPVSSATQPSVILRPPPAPVVINDRGEVVTSRSRRELVGILPLTGFNLSNPQQVLLGVRGDIRIPGRAIRFLPEMTMGFGEENTSYTISTNAAYPFNIEVGRFRPYIGAGVGFAKVNDFELVLNTFIGAERIFSAGSFFGEYYTLDFFNESRILVGYRVNF